MITIIGAGPAGSYLAYLLSKNNKKVQLFEEHDKIGIPMQCTGIVTSSIEKIINLPKNTIINRISKVNVFFPDNRSIQFNLKKPNLILDRTRFDQHLAKLAEKAGAKIYLNHRFIEKNNNKIIIQNKKNNQIKKIKTKILIGADGPLSKTRKIITRQKIKFYKGVQARIRLKNNNMVEFYPYLATFAWIVPENKNIVRLGLVSKTNTKHHFNQFLKTKNIKKSQIIDYQGGLIPLYNPKLKIKKNNTLIIGDAAAQVKATTMGGIIQGMTAAQCIANPDKKIQKHLSKDLLLHLIIRNIMNRFTKKDWIYLSKLCTKKRTKTIIESFDRDYPSKFIIRLILKEPRFLYFIKNIIC